MIPIRAKWSDKENEPEKAAAFFLKNTTPGDYISHTDIQWGRAASFDAWRDDFCMQIKMQLIKSCRARQNDKQSDAIWTALLYRDDILAGLSLVTLNKAARVPYIIIEDLIIAEEQRDNNLGTGFIRWIMSECRSIGFRRVFIESSMKNTRAHNFFSHAGFTEVSLVMSRQLE